MKVIITNGKTTLLHIHDRKLRVPIHIIFDIIKRKSVPRIITLIMAQIIPTHGKDAHAIKPFFKK